MPDERQRALAGRDAAKLGQQAGLAHPGVAAHDDHRRRTVPRAGDRRGELCQLGGPADERDDGEGHRDSLTVRGDNAPRDADTARRACGQRRRRPQDDLRAARPGPGAVTVSP